MAEKDKLEKITILRATIFDREPVEAGEVCQVSDQSMAGAQYLIARGKAVAGGKAKKPDDGKNKAVDPKEIDRK